MDKRAVISTLVLAVLFFALDMLHCCGYSSTGMLIDIAMICVLPGYFAIIPRNHPWLWSLAPGAIYFGVGYLVEVFIRKSGYGFGCFANLALDVGIFAYWFLSVNLGLETRAINAAKAAGAK